VTNPLRAALGAAVVVFSLAACVSILPKTTPAQLYGLSIAVPPAAAGDASRGFNVERLPTDFAGEAGGSQILTVDGGEAAYIADVRWDAPAAQLFDQAETLAFDRASGPARLLRPGEPAAAPVSLTLDVQTFEARYLAGPKAAPTVVVSVHALLADTSDRKVIADEVFESQRPAVDDRVGAIVDAFDAATTDVLTRIVDWTSQEGAQAKAG
jgi:cholesterol transport system auxiliary component